MEYWTTYVVFTKLKETRRKSRKATYKFPDKRRPVNFSFSTPDGSCGRRISDILNPDTLISCFKFLSWKLKGLKDRLIRYHEFNDNLSLYRINRSNSTERYSAWVGCPVTNIMKYYISPSI